MKRQKLRKEKDEKGITLIALVVTIIILLILAGVAIASVTGDNGLFRRAKEATTLSKIANVEEEAKMIYLEMLMGENIGGMGETSFSRLIDKLEEKGYVVEQKVLGEVTGVSIDNSNLVISAGETGTIKITYEGASGGKKYYIKIDDKYYEISEENGDIKISKEAEEIKTDGSKLDVKVTSGNDKITIKEEGNNIKVTAGENSGTATITITYGTKEPVVCNVTITKMPTEDTKPTNAVPTFSTDYGKIDVIWLNRNSNRVATSANEPNLLKQNKEHLLVQPEMYMVFMICQEERMNI